VTAVWRLLFGTAFIAAGILHFVYPAYYQAIVPPYLPAPAALVAVSGGAEILGGAGLLVRRWRRAAGWGLIALMLAVFPANVEMLRQAREHGASALVQAALWLRLPFQGVLIWWAWRLSRANGPDDERAASRNTTLTSARPQAPASGER
jgi:uncharacterized membrane protein